MSSTREIRRRRPGAVRALEERSPLNAFFTGGVELDARVDLEIVRAFTAHFQWFTAALRVSPWWGYGVSLKFRRLGRHRADGMYFPEEPSIVLDPSSPRSFAHELGHLIDYRAVGGARGMGPRPGLSPGGEFLQFRDVLLERMARYRRCDPRLSGRKGRISWAYFSSSAECFARAFEQVIADVLPAPCLLARERARYRCDPLFFDRIPPALRLYFLEALLKNPCGETSNYRESREAHSTPYPVFGRPTHG